MKPDRRAILLFLAGVMIMTGIAAFQISSELIYGSVYYILLSFYGLWLLRQYKYLSAIGVIATVAMAVGFLFGREHSDGALINRVFSILTIWSAVIFTARFRVISQREQKYKKQLKALFENVSEGILMADANGRIILGNPGIEKILSYAHDELVHMRIEDLIPERLRTNHDTYRHSFMRDPSNRQVGAGTDVFALTKDGREVPVEVSLSSYNDADELFVIAFVTDITKRKEQEAKIAAHYEEMQQYNLRLEEQVRFRTSELEIINQELVREIEERKVVEERLRKSQLMYKAVANNFPDGIIGILDSDLRYLFVEGKELSPASAGRVGQESQNLLEVPAALIRSAEDKLRPVFRGLNVQFELLVSANHYEVVATPLTRQDEHVTEILIVVRNITRHKKLEENLLRSLEKEKQLNVLKSRFVTSVSHEFRTPLSTILSSAYLVEKYRGSDEAAHRLTHLNRIRRSVSHLTELLEDFLSLEKLEEGKVKVVPSNFHLRSFLVELMEEMTSFREKDQVFDLVFEGDDGPVALDRSLLTNILINLISNAVKYSLPDGRISIHAERSTTELTIRVGDNGIGIPEKEQKHVFKRFFRGGNAVNIEGTGLGLNLVRKYVRLLKGHISFTSKLNHGSTFTVTIPVAVPETVNVSNSGVYV